MGTPTDVQRLVDLLGDADPDVRLRAALDLGEGRHAAAADALVDRFGVERDFAIREILTWAVLRMPDAALPLVRRVLTSARWLARLQATHTLSKRGEHDDGERLIPLVADPVDAVAARAYWAVAQCGDPGAVPALVGELSRGSAEHRNSLTVALTHFGEAAVPALVGALRHGRTAAVRCHAADTLGYLGSPVADPAAAALTDAVGDVDEWVRLAALNALGQLVLPAAWQVVEARAAAPESRLRLLAERLLERRPGARALRAAAVRASSRAPLLVDDTAGHAPAPAWPAADLGLVTCDGGAPAAELAPTLALQVQWCRPQYLARGDVPGDVLERVGAEAAARARAAGRSEAMADRIAAGRVEQFVHEHVLLEQVSVVDPGKTVADLLFGRGVRITGFVRLDPDEP